MRKKLGERRHCFFVTSIDEKTLGGQTPEHVVMSEGFDQFFPGSIFQIERWGLVFLVNQSVNATMSTVAVGIDVRIPRSALRLISATV